MNNIGAVLYSSNDLRVEDRAVPTPHPHEVLVHVRAVGICGSDIHYYEHGRIGSYVIKQPMVVGHESSGLIVDAGSEVDSSRIGEKVALEPGVPCRRCEQCLQGTYNLCSEVRFFATPPVDGSITTYVTLDADFAHRAPDRLSFEEIALAEPVSVGIWAARRAEITLDDRVLVTGAGPIGLYSAQVARAFGASSILITDLNEFRLSKARELGFKTAHANGPVTGDFDVLLECSGASAAIQDGMEHLAPRGRIVLVGMGTDVLSINLPLIQNREITVTGIFRYANTYPAALRLISTGDVNVRTTITHRFPIEHTEQALTLAHREPSSLKAVVNP